MQNKQTPQGQIEHLIAKVRSIDKLGTLAPNICRSCSLSWLQEEISQLKDVFFQLVFSPKIGTVPADYVYPQLCATTGTMSYVYLQSLSLLTTIGFPQKTIQWSSPLQFVQQNIHINFICSPKHVKIWIKSWHLSNASQMSTVASSLDQNGNRSNSQNPWRRNWTANYWLCM